MENVYLSVSSNLFKESIEFATQFIQKSDDDLSIMQDRKTLIFESTTLWIKKSGDKEFDVPMGCLMALNHAS